MSYKSRAVFERIAVQEAWTTDTMVEVLLQYLEQEGGDDCFLLFLQDYVYKEEEGEPGTCPGCCRPCRIINGEYNCDGCNSIYPVEEGNEQSVGVQ